MVCLQKEENNYPILLKNIKSAPQELYIEGDLKCLELPCITIVGSRNMSDYGRNMTKTIVQDFTLAGFCIVSGLAIGIDSVAHKTCLENGGKTIAVIGSGLNKIYPKENIGLFKDIINCGGCVISEHEPNQEADKIFFPARNRIVSGLSLGTVVIEATYRSGTSITANFALKQGRKLFCLPNMIGHKNSAGTLNLIKKGAMMVTKTDEIISELSEQLKGYDKFIKYEKIKKKGKEYQNIEEGKYFDKIKSMEENEKIIKTNLKEQEIIGNLDDITKFIYMFIKDNKIVNSETLSNELNISIQDVNSNLTILELNGLIENKFESNYAIKEEFDV